MKHIHFTKSVPLFFSILFGFLLLWLFIEVASANSTDEQIRAPVVSTLLRRGLHVALWPVSPPRRPQQLQLPKRRRQKPPLRAI